MQLFKELARKFFNWYERHYSLNVGIASTLFVWQLVHLTWLLFYVIWERLFGYSLFSFSGFWNYLIIIVDYTEIPALILTSIIYLNDLRKEFKLRSLGFLLLLNSQWLHLFWITDEFVVGQFAGTEKSILPVWLAWVAILIDYLELPVMFDTVRRFFKALSQKG